jgi:hypothetical protein
MRLLTPLLASKVAPMVAAIYGTFKIVQPFVFNVTIIFDLAFDRET